MTIEELIEASKRIKVTKAQVEKLKEKLASEESKDTISVSEEFLNRRYTL